MRNHLTRKRVRLALLLFVIAAPAFPQGLGCVKENYTKHEYTIPMRDGVRLFTSVYIPMDRSISYPILLSRTSYSVAPYGADRYRDCVGPSFLFADAGCIICYLDCRG